MTSLAERFHALFRGADDCHGTYGREEGSGTKREIKASARTLRAPPTSDLWRKHLEGTRPIGIVPVDARGDCWWGAVDIDAYDIDHLALARHLSSLGVPALVCRTKSGGAHVFLFFSESVPAGELMPRLRELAALLGRGESEVFPKQERALREKGDFGNWLNMPYFAGDRTERYCVGSGGPGGLSPEKFLDTAEAIRMSRTALGALPLRPTAEGFDDGPPCLETLAANGFPEGSRNNGLFMLGILAKKKSPEGWEALLEQWNQSLMHPPLPASEVGLVIRSLRKKDYLYRCQDQPAVSHCNLALCRQRPHGVGVGGGVAVLESASVVVTEPPLFFVNLKIGGTVEVGARALLEPALFQLAVLNQLRQVIPLFPKEGWLRAVARIVEGAVQIEVPEDVSTAGRFHEILEKFCTDQYRAESRDEVILGKPWLDEESGRVWFRLQDLEAALARTRFTDYTRPQLTARIRELGGGSGQFDARGKNVRAWYVAARRLQWQTAAHRTPRQDEPPI